MNLNYDANEFLTPLFWISLKTALLVIITAIVLYGTRSLSTQTRYSVWFTVVTASLLLPLFNMLLPVLPVSFLPIGHPEAANAPVGFVNSNITAANAATGGMNSAMLLVVVYLCGCTAALVSFMYALRRLALVSRAMCETEDPRLLAIKDEVAMNAEIRRPVKLMISNEVNTPMTWGIFRPRIALPEGALSWPDRHLRNALLHEICHIRQYDWLRLWVMKAAATVYWFNPFVWLAVRQFSYECERACDDYVLRSGGRCSDYAEQLLGIMADRQGGRLSSIGIALGKKNFLKRVRAILDPGRKEGSMGRYKTILLSLGVLCGAALVGACQPSIARLNEGLELNHVPGDSEQGHVTEISDREFTKIHQRKRSEIDYLENNLMELEYEMAVRTRAGEDITGLEEQLYSTRLRQQLSRKELEALIHEHEQRSGRVLLRVKDRSRLDETMNKLREQELALMEKEQMLKNQMREQQSAMHGQQRKLQQRQQELRRQMEQQQREFEQQMQRQQQELQVALREQEEQLQQRTDELRMEEQDLKEYKRVLYEREQKLKQMELELIDQEQDAGK